jgi:glutamine synthetase
VLDDPAVKEVFEKYGVLSNRELHSRLEVYLELYCKSIAVEARTTVEMARTIIFPAAIRYQGELAATCANLRAVDYTFDTNTLDKMTALVKELQDGIGAIEASMASNGTGSLLEHAEHYCSEVLPAMQAVRKTSDELEGMVADDLWPLATYQEMLFIK